MIMSDVYDGRYIFNLITNRNSEVQDNFLTAKGLRERNGSRYTAFHGQNETEHDQDQT
jgi:hypothetical protein